MKNTQCSVHTLRGFSLLEMSIVLVVIGLVIGGVIVGSELIEAARIRGFVSQYDSIRSGVRSFNLKYGGLPGDLDQDYAKQVGLFDRTSLSRTGNGDNNGFIQSCRDDDTSATHVAGCENLLFWRDLNTAGFLKGDFQYATLGNADAGNAIPNEDIYKFFPEAELPGNFWVVFYEANSNTVTYEPNNYYAVTAIDDIAANGGWNLNQRITPFTAKEVDRKIDDGEGLTGSVIGFKQQGSIDYRNVETTATCVRSDTLDYNLDAAYVDTQICQLRLNF